MTDRGFDRKNIPLNRPGWDQWLIMWLPLVAFAQWALIVPLVYQNSIWTSNADAFRQLGLAEGAKVKGFANDFFYAVWNILPILLWGVYFYARRAFPKDWQRLEPMFESSDQDARVKRILRVRDHWIVIVVIVLIAGLATFAQYTKQMGFIESRAIAYWWDWRISKAIFAIRAVALFTNMILVVAIFWHTAMALLMLNSVAKHSDIHPQVFHPDNHCGLKPFGNLLAALILPFVLGAFVGGLGWLDHRGGQSVFNVIGDLSLVTGTTAIAMFMFFRPAYHIYSELSEDVARIRGLLERFVGPLEIAKNLEKLDPETAAHDQTVIPVFVNNSAQINLLRAVQTVKPWPFDTKLVTKVVILAASPLATILGSYVKILFKTYWFPS